MDSDSKQQETGDDLPEVCRATRRMIASFVGSENKHKGEQGFRSHLTQCSECMLVYRQTMSAAARMGRSLREDRDDSDRELRRRGTEKRVKKATGDPGRRNRFALRLALLPAAFALLIFVQRALRTPEGLTVHWKGGEVHVGELRLNSDFPKCALTENGTYCYTRGNARAEIFSNTDAEQKRFELGLESTLFVTDPGQLEVRLESGELLVFGESRVTSQYGIVEMTEGRAQISIRDLEFKLECLEGQLTFITPAGEEVLQEGMRLTRGG